MRDYLYSIGNRSPTAQNECTISYLINYYLHAKLTSLSLRRVMIVYPCRQIVLQFFFAFLASRMGLASWRTYPNCSVLLLQYLGDRESINEGDTFTGSIPKKKGRRNVSKIPRFLLALGSHLLPRARQDNTLHGSTPCDLQFINSDQNLALQALPSIANLRWNPRVYRTIGGE